MDVVVVGAGIAGVSTAHRLTTEHGMSVALVDPLPPLTLTSDKSTECYRNWWPNKAMVGLMNRSIDLLEDMADDTGNVFGLSRRGYLFLTADPEALTRWKDQATVISSHGGGEVRSHHDPSSYLPADDAGFSAEPDGIDLLIGGDTIRHHYPYVTENAIAALHIRRAGWFSAQQLGSWMIEAARDAGLTLMASRVSAIIVGDGAVSGVELDSGEKVNCNAIVDAAGPMAAAVGRMAGLDLPLRSELHLKVAFRDHLGVVPREAPMLIWSDSQELTWDDDETAALREAGRTDLLGTMPIFCHGRPEGGPESPYFLALWEYHDDVRDEPVWPLPDDELYPEVVARGLTTMIPGFSQYLSGLPHSTVDGGYYTKTPENRPLIGPAGPDGFFLACGYSGFGVMVAPGAADLVAAHIVGGELPTYEAAFRLDRYDHPSYRAEIDLTDSGQL